MPYKSLDSSAARSTALASARRFVAFVHRYKWTVGGCVVLGGMAFYLNKLLRYVPVREVLIMIAESEDKADMEIKSVLRGGEACRILKAFLVDVGVDLTKIFDVQEKQAAAQVRVEHAEGDSASKSAQNERRMVAFKELSIASFSRTITAVYVLCFLEIFVHTQLFELKKQRKLGCRLHEGAQRKFLSVAHGISTGEDSVLRRIASRVDCSVREFFNAHAVTEKIDSAGVIQIIRDLRRRVEREADGAEAADGNDSGQAWICKLALTHLRSRMPTTSGPSPYRSESDEQLQQLLSTMAEVIESEVLAEALSAATDSAFALLEEDLRDALFPPERPASPGAPPPSPQPGQVALVKLAPAASNLFARVLEPISSAGQGDSRAYASAVLRSQACEGLFAAVSAA